ncbi:unknown [Neodiprion lecontei nucleopolyhedrovirus]|uniref:Uncharacterized protein n=1 Tax=Neodiprion lecontei nucleopolyhedrovirus (strain Canada) TaxID=654906 RepID=Q6JPE3_NPVNC|nr:unknown [Neodiprion lecontei nucleopolyhedrovirus]AAQ99096.1 unknown [Neodiprion lecontei nucleopolyhedrovirus]
MSFEKEERCESLFLGELRRLENPHVITHLNLKHDDNVENTYLPLLGDDLRLCLPNLVYLKIFLFVVNMEKISDALQGCPNLQHLVIITWGDCHDDDIGDTSYEINMDMTNFLKLRTIDIILTQDVWKFRLVSPTITKLQIQTENEEDDDDSLKLYHIECPNLEILYKNEVFLHNIIDNIDYCPKKKEIGLFEESGESDILYNHKILATDSSFFFLPNLKYVRYKIY